MASNKLTNYQLNIIVDKIWKELNQEIAEKNREIINNFDIHSNQEASKALMYLSNLLDIRKNIEDLEKKQKEIKSLLNKKFKTSYYSYNLNSIEEIEDYVKKHFTNDDIIYLSKRDIELEVLTNQNSDVSTLINTIIEKFKEKLTN